MIGQVRKSLEAGLYPLLRKADVDRPVFYGVMTRAWTVFSGPVTALLIATRFSPEVQGYYYTFLNLLALQIFIELGFGIVIIQFASHEWSKLGLNPEGEIEGDPESLSRLASLAKVAMKWYVAGGGAAALGLGFAGYLFFSRSPAADVAWASPWFVLCALTGVNLALIPIWSLLEGCNQVTSLYLFRFFQGLFSILAVWIAIVLGADLWAASIGTAATLVCAWAYLRKKYRNFLKSLFGYRSGGPALDWRGDILPMQWRFAVSSISGYFMFSLFTPVLFHFHGPALAGRFGMTWSVVGLISSISYSWIAPKVPQFGMMIALKDYDTLDRSFRRMTKIVLGVAIVLSIGCWLCVYGLNFFRHSIAERILPPLPTAVLLLGQVLLTLSMPFSTYLRAHKKEPLLLVSVASGLMTGVSTLLLGKLYAANGAAAGYFAVNVLMLPFVVAIWNRCRRSWHSVDDYPASLFPG